MPHADSSYIPEDIQTKAQFYAHVNEQLSLLLEGNRYWVSNLSLAASLLYHSYLSSSIYGYNNHSTDEHVPVVNWVGFYLHPPSPSPAYSNSIPKSTSPPLLLGPYNGRPACQYISLPDPKSNSNKPRGVCAESFISSKTVIVDDVNSFPGHIACDGSTKSEIVLPLIIPSQSHDGSFRAIGVLDLDSTVLKTFDTEDEKGLQGVLNILRDGCDWF